VPEIGVKWKPDYFNEGSPAMAMIECSECGTQISDKAAACIKCGAPIGNQSGSAAPVHPIVTTELTGKKYKKMQLLSVMLIAASVVSCVAKEPQAGAWLLIIGVGLYVSSRVGAWWNHG
jgi:hypothetical protein